MKLEHVIRYLLSIEIACIGCFIGAVLYSIGIGNSGNFILPTLIFFLYPLVCGISGLLFFRRIMHKSMPFTPFEFTMAAINVSLIIICTIVVFEVFFSGLWMRFALV